MNAKNKEIMRRIPDKIYMQFHGQDSCELPDTDLEQYDEESEVTWCEDRINDTDVEYIRKPSYYVNVLGCHGGGELRDRFVKAAEEYAASIAQHEERKNWCAEVFLAGVESALNSIADGIKQANDDFFTIKIPSQSKGMRNEQKSSNGMDCV